jgi:hypothetical protein
MPPELEHSFQMLLRHGGKSVFVRHKSAEISDTRWKVPALVVARCDVSQASWQVLPATLRSSLTNSSYARPTSSDSAFVHAV